MEPAASIIRSLGGTAAVATLTGVHRTRVSSWRWPKDKRGTGGRIPQNHHRVILAAMRKVDPSFDAESLIAEDEMEAA